ncbi:NAD(P)-dependent oxidoreductase [Tunicatimonas pelagia]|uniref:NAD(P)-dependent oxidoreductase n=1 Tax=Tunicatimonas pelagia TaxID=931531 RepID=UPI0026651D0F|nr:NAD(P)-binding oxidoreductase [Tunicatimonas pelagia]WKN43760.1 SDR family oxidoreductase [Tunicatimonas pelagia]
MFQVALATNADLCNEQKISDMRIVLLGATGFSGKKVLQQLLKNNHQVTALVRSVAKVQVKHSNLSIVKGNVLDTEVLEQVLSHQEAVINCLGIGGKGNGQPNSFVSTATAKVVRAMEKQGVARLICLSNVGAGDSAHTQPWLFRKIILPYFMKWLKVIIDDKNVMEPIVMNSQLDWTIVRCPNVVAKAPKNTIRTSVNGKKVKLSITNQDLANFLVAQLSSALFSKQVLSISN